MKNTLESPQELLEKGSEEHLKPPSPIYDYSNITGYNVTINNFNIVGEGGPEPDENNKKRLYI